MKPSHLHTGIKGEDTAARYLRKNRYKVKERNVRFGRDEIDIVAFDTKEKMVVFVEVKTRNANLEQYPIRTAIDQRKRQCLKRAAAKWCIKHEYDGPARIDVICVSRGNIVEHIQELGREFD